MGKGGENVEDVDNRYQGVTVISYEAAVAVELLD